MIKIIILIIVSVWLFSAGCSGGDSEGQQPAPDTSLSGDPEGTAADDPLKQLRDEGKLPDYGTGGVKAPVLPSGSGVLAGSGPEVTSLYLPAVDPDGDNVPNVPVPGHPDVDNCPTVFNPDQTDTKHNGVGDACE